jgi:hypothetical protein
MRPEDIIVSTRGGGRRAPMPLDMELQALDTELEAAGAHARRMLNGQRQPTRYYSLELRTTLLDALEEGWPTRVAGPEPAEVSPISRR